VGLLALTILFLLHTPVCLAVAAAATTASGDTVVNFQPLVNNVLQIVAMVLMALGSWAAAWLARKFKLDALSPELEKLIHEGVQFGTNKLKRLAKGKTKVDVHSDIAEEALGYAVRNGPKLIRKLGYNKEQLRDKILSKILPDEDAHDQASAGPDNQ
jgi:hypothetical protein